MINPVATVVYLLCFATSAGCRYELQPTSIPKRIVVVSRASAAIVTQGSSWSAWGGVTTPEKWSSSQTVSYPSCSASRQCSARAR